MLTTACSTSGIDKALGNTSVDAALCTELKTPIDDAVSTTLKLQRETPAEVINGWTQVVRGYDAVC